MKLYETIIIFKPSINFTDKRREYEQVFKKTTDHIYLHDLGTKALAYTVKGCRRGRYILFCYDSNDHWVNTDLDLKLRQDDDVIKFLTTHLEEEDKTLAEYTRISLSEQDNKKIDALDVLLGFETYYREEVK